MGIGELLGRYVNWADRFVARRPRRVITWEGFERTGSPQSHREAVEHLANKIEAGDDMTPFLSDDISRLGYVRPKNPSRKEAKRRGVEWGDKDYALNAFETHHLHLSPKGSRELLYVIFSRADAFFLMLGDHRSFDDGTLAQALAESRVGTPQELKGIGPIVSPRHMREQNKLQRYGFTTVYPVASHTVLGALLSSTGTSPLHTMHADRIILTINKFEPKLDEPGFGREWFEQNGRTFPARYAFEWVMQGCDLYLVETTTLIGFPMVNWIR